MVIFLKEKLKEIMEQELKALNNMLEALEEQHKYIAKNELIPLSEVVEKIEQCNKSIAKIEIERRKITKGEAMSKLIEEMKDSHLEFLYRSINKLLKALEVQKDTNEMLIKRGLNFSSQMVNLLKPDRSAKTYNAQGRSK